MRCQQYLEGRLPGPGDWRDMESGGEKGVTAYSRFGAWEAVDGGAISGSKEGWKRIMGLVFETLLYLSPPDFLVNKN